VVGAVEVAGAVEVVEVAGAGKASDYSFI